jgi:SAM-dependent methyltransferase
MCGSTQVDASWQCAACHGSPAVIDGVVAFSPELARASSGFKPEYFERLAAVEEGNFWFVGRNALIAWAARRFFSETERFCEIGCGTGYVLRGLAKAMPAWKLCATEIYTDGIPFASARVPGAIFFQLDARSIPFVEEFDVMGAFDVIEHIEEDRTVLAQMYRAIAPGGGVLLTVPQHPFLWSQQDEHACHVRRYTASDLREKLEHAGFRVELMSSFVSLLFPLMYLTRRRDRVPESEYDFTADLKLSPALNSILTAAMSLERLLIKAGLRLPFGGSLLVVARKPGNAL